MKHGGIMEIKERGTPDFPIELYRIDSEHSRYIMPFHWHSDIELIRIEEGELNLVIGEQEYLGRAGDVFVINSGIIHGGTPKNSVYNCIVFDTSLLIGKSSASNDIKRIFGAESLIGGSFYPCGEGNIDRYVDMLIKILASDSDSRRLRTVGLLYSLFGELLDRGIIEGAPFQGRQSNSVKMKTVLSWIENNYQEPITLSRLSELVGMTPGYFCEFFKKFTRKSPIDYINMFRIDSACHMLCISDCSVTEAAFSCGFNDLSYFVKTFKKYKGVTPKDYKAQYFAKQNIIF